MFLGRKAGWGSSWKSGKLGRYHNLAKELFGQLCYDANEMHNPIILYNESN